MKSGFKWMRDVVPVVAAAAVVSACQTVNTTHTGAVGIERRQMMMVSSGEMEKASSQSYHKILQQAAQNAGSGSAVGRKTYQKGLETLQWRADDENDDELVYEVQFRREGETTWKVLRSGLTDSILVWDTTTVPNGTTTTGTTPASRPCPRPTRPTRARCSRSRCR